MFNWSRVKPNNVGRFLGCLMRFGEPITLPLLSSNITFVWTCLAVGHCERGFRRSCHYHRGKILKHRLSFTSVFGHQMHLVPDTDFFLLFFFRIKYGAASTATRCYMRLRPSATFHVCIHSLGGKTCCWGGFHRFLHRKSRTIALWIQNLL